MTKDIIVKSNHLIEASYYLTLNEQRVILLAIAQIYRKEGIQMTDLFRVCARDFAKQFDLKCKRSVVSPSLVNACLLPQG